MAVLTVLAQHYLSWLPRVGAAHGWLGVDLFFILSGFLITSILFELSEQEHYFKVFYFRRALRIFPPYFLLMTVYLVLSFASGKPGSLGLWAQYIFYYTSLFVGQPSELSQNILLPPVALGLGVMWSLSVEEIYYTIWAPIVRFTDECSFSFILGCMIVAAPLLRWHFHTPNYPEVYTFYCRMDGLAYGSVLALLLRHRHQSLKSWERLDRFLDWAAIGAAMAALGFWWITKGNRAHLLVTTLGITLADIVFAQIVFAAIRHAGGDAWWSQALRIKWLRSIGMVSYSLYLVHYPLRSVAIWLVQFGHFSKHEALILEITLGLTLSFGTAYMLWYGMESRILRLKDRYVTTQAHELTTSTGDRSERKKHVTPHVRRLQDRIEQNERTA
jgi:peptidoglycan/LPS O-acetylase OafA/YrhL